MHTIQQTSYQPPAMQARQNGGYEGMRKAGTTTNKAGTQDKHVNPGMANTVHEQQARNRAAWKHRAGKGGHTAAEGRF